MSNFVLVSMNGKTPLAWKDLQLWAGRLARQIVWFAILLDLSGDQNSRRSWVQIPPGPPLFLYLGLPLVKVVDLSGDTIFSVCHVLPRESASFSLFILVLIGL